MADNIQMGDTVRCIHAASSWYTVGQEYQVVPHPVEGSRSVQGSDGHYDMLSLVVSKFEKLTNKKKKVVPHAI